MNEYGVPCLDLSQTSDTPQLFQPLSLWKLVEQHIPGAERWEVKNMLGANLVDESLVLHDEVLLLTDILKDYEDQEGRVVPLVTRMPEPPQARERLIKEISFFVESIQEKFASRGNSSRKVLAKYNKNVLDYVDHKTKRDSLGSSRPSSSLSLSSDGQHNSLSTPSTDRSSVTSSLSDEIQELSHSLNILQIDDVVQHLRSTLQTEISQLLSDVQILQNSMAERIELTSPDPCKSVPTLSELRQERTMLEKELLKETDNDEFFDVIPSTLRKRLSSQELCQNVKDQTERWCNQNAPMPQRRSSISMLRQDTDVLQRRKNRPVSGISDVNNSSSIKSLIGGQFVPRPPTVSQPRQRTADKFRRMIYHCRDKDNH